MSAARIRDVPSRNPPPASDARDRPCGLWGRVGTAADTPSQPHAMSPLPSSAAVWTLSRPPVPPRSRPDIPGRVLSGGRTRVHPFGRLLFVLRECGQRAKHRPPRFLPCPSHGDGPRRCRGRQGYPFPTAEKDLFPGWGRGLPRRVVCLAAGQHRQQTGCRREARAPKGAARASALASLSPPPPGGHHGAGNPAVGQPAHEGLPPLPRWSAAITPGSTRVETPRYPAGGPAVPVAGA
jgi:hypothetical protein